jgi:beta-xylosidase
MRVFFLFLFSLLVGTAGVGATVAVHDPSVVVLYKDADGNSFPEQNESKSRTKFYYVMGTQLEAAYSKDLLNWTHFQPSFSVNGSETKDFLKVFAENATWSNHYDNAKMKENLWAPDVIYNRALKKWCLYFSVNGDDWLSSIALLTSDRIEGPYEFKGTVVCSGMDNFSSGLGNIDYKKVTGSDRIASRYMKDGKWIGEYGSSCIDPSVLYDEKGNLWMFYGSWSGGIFLIKLDENTGLRDYSHNFGYGNSSEIWDNKSLVYDPYMGLHIAGGYYVSGEGSYVEYIKDPNGKGYYYLFMSYGFYHADSIRKIRLISRRQQRP